MKAKNNVLKKLRQEIITTANTIFEEELVKLTFGVVSARIPDTDLIMITPSGFSKAKVKTGELLILDLDANLVEGDLRPSVESKVHCYIHKTRPDVGGIIHTHPPIASGFASANVEIPCVSTQQAFVFGGAIPLAECYIMPGSQKETDLNIIAKALRKTKAVLLRNHGVIAIGETLKEALDNTIVVEDSAHVALVSILLNKKIEVTGEQIDDLARLKTRYGQKPNVNRK